jgi:hypothetical protein
VGTRAVNFLGRSYVKPGARGVVRSRPQPPELGRDFNTMIIIGEAENGTCITSGEDNVLMDYAKSVDAVYELKKGNLVEAISAAFSPSQDTRFLGTQLVRAINVAKTVKAETFLETTGGTPSAPEKLKVIAKIPGKAGNNIRIGVNGNSISIFDGGDPIVLNKFVANEIKLLYTGDATKAIVSVTKELFKIDLTGQTDGSANINLQITDYPTIGDLAEKLNNTQGYSAIVLSQADNPIESLDEISSSENVDLVASGSVTLTGIASKQKKFLVSTGLVTIDDTGIARKPLKDMSGTSQKVKYLSNGSYTPATPQDYIKAIDYLAFKRPQGFYVNLCTTDMSINSYFVEYLNKTNSPDGSFEKFGGTGLSKELPVQDRIDFLKSMNTAYTVCGVSPVQRFSASDPTVIKEFDGWMVAILHNAIKASANMRESATFKDLNVKGCPETLKDTDLQNLLLAGGLVVDRKPNGGAFKIVMGVTTYQKTNIIFNQASISCTALAMTKYLREALELTYTGEIPPDENDVRRFVNGIFKNDFVEKFGWLTPNIYTGESAYDENFTIKRDGDVYYFEFPRGNVASPINYMFFLLELDVVRGSSST